jgi:hypothetical protein
MVAGEAEAGFLLSPVIEGNSDYTALAGGEMQSKLAAKEVRSITFSQIGWVGKGFAYQPSMSVEFSRLTIEQENSRR